MRPIAYAPHIRAMGELELNGNRKNEKSYSCQPESHWPEHRYLGLWTISRCLWQPGSKACRIMLEYFKISLHIKISSLRIHRSQYMRICIKIQVRKTRLEDNSRCHLLKYSTAFSIMPTKQEAQHARQASMAAIGRLREVVIRITDRS